ncbi:MAG: hypothetical protein ABIP49_09105 [Lysobacterales bacterium]
MTPRSEVRCRILRVELDAWIMQGRLRSAAALALMQEAAELEAATPKHRVTPAPVLPASEQLGDLLADLGKSEAALAAYKRSMANYPQRFNTVLGAARAARASKDAKDAQTFYRALLSLAADASPRPALAEARTYGNDSKLGRR